MWRPTTSPTRTRTRRGARAVAALAATAALFAVPAASGTGAATAAPYCGITWGSLAKTSAPLAAGRVYGVRAGRHACFDRLVLDMTGPAPGFDVWYVTTVLTRRLASRRSPSRAAPGSRSWPTRARRPSRRCRRSPASRPSAR